MSAPDVAPIPLTREQIELIQEWAANDRLWGSKEATQTNLYTFARLILKYANDEKDREIAHLERVLAKQRGEP